MSAASAMPISASQPKWASHCSSALAICCKNIDTLEIFSNTQRLKWYHLNYEGTFILKLVRDMVTSPTNRNKPVTPTTPPYSDTDKQCRQTSLLSHPSIEGCSTQRMPSRPHTVWQYKLYVQSKDAEMLEADNWPNINDRSVYCPWFPV